MIGDREIKECEIAAPCSYYFKVNIGEQEETAETYLMPLPLDIEFRFDLFGHESNVMVTAFRNSEYVFPLIDIPENALGVILSIHVNERNFPTLTSEWVLKEDMELNS
uniref:Uncharacterized protein n=1 Tax=Panagrolaimus davidi TaxID=227884 RepID=A0A914Q190_9BILA